MKQKHTYLKGLAYLSIFFIMFTGVLLVKQRSISLADTATNDDIWMAAGTSKLDSDYEMKTLSMSVTIQHNNDVSSIDSIIWDSTNKAVATMTESATIPNMATVTAISAGKTEIMASVNYTDQGGASHNNVVLLCTLDVQDAIKTELNGVFRNNVKPNDVRPSLVACVDYDASGVADPTSVFTKLEMNYDSVVEQWDSGDNNIVTVDQFGNVRVVGAGVTTITASFTPKNETVSKTDTIDVYVIPKVSGVPASAANPDFTATQLKIHTQEGILTDAASGVDQSNGILDRLTWVITGVQNGAQTVLDVETKEHVDRNSVNFPSSDIINLVPDSDALQRNRVRVNARAGVYTIYFFPTGVYEANAQEKGDKFNISELSNYYTSIGLTVYGEFGDIDGKRSAYLNVGDSFDVAAAFNMTTEDFTNLLSSNLTDSASEQIFAYNSSSASGNAKSQGSAIIRVAANSTSAVSSYGNCSLNNIWDKTKTTDLSNLEVKINVADGLYLDRTSVTMAVGASLTLIETHSVTGGTFKWESSDPNTVSVTQNGKITASKETKENQPVSITLTQKLTNGNIKRAVCKVKVVSTVTNITLNYKDLNVEVDKTVTILASFTPNVSTAPIKWLSSNQLVADLGVAADNKSVVITGKMPGTTIITAVNSDNFVTASCMVTVLSPIQSIVLDNSQLNVKLSKQEVKLKATYTPSTATSTDLIWSTSNSAVATVDEGGLVTLLTAGTTIITVQPEYNPYLCMDQCVLTVTQSTTGLSLSNTEMTIEAGTSEKLIANLTPSNASSDITYKSMNTKVASVSADGTVAGITPGKTYIIATTENGYSDSCLVIVTKAATGVSLDVYHLTLAVGRSYQVIAVPEPVTSSEVNFTWTSKNSSIASVNSSGKVTAVKAGETEIFVKTKSGKVTYLYVNVYDKVTSMSLNYSSKTLVKGKSFVLKAVFTPSNATNKNVTWKSSKTSVATVSSGGKVRGKKGGTAVITARSKDGGFVDICVVTVDEAITSISLSKTSYSLGVGKSIKLTAKVTSTYATNQKLSWTSSNVKVATVTQSGVVKGKKLGTAYIKCKATDGSGVYKTCKIRVIRQATKITLNKTTIRMLVGKTTKITAKVSPSNATYKTVLWSSSDEDIATVDSSGYISAEKVGVCKIYAKAKDNSGKKVYCYVHVSKAVPSTGVKIATADKNMVLVKGTSSMINYTISPNNTTDTVKFYSDNKAAVSVSSTGRVTARKPGVATISIITSSQKIGMVNVTVVGLNRTSITTSKYERVELWVEQVPSGVRWYSENSSIASVDQSGSVVTRKKGTTRIIANVKGVRLYCTVKVR